MEGVEVRGVGNEDGGIGGEGMIVVEKGEWGR